MRIKHMINFDICVHLWHCHQIKITNVAMTLEVTSSPLNPPLTPSSTATDLLSVTVQKVPWSEVSYKWSHTMRALLLTGFFHSAQLFWDTAMFLVPMAHFSFCWVVFHCMDMPPFVHLPVDGHLGCFQFLTLTNKPARELCVGISVWTYVLIWGIIHTFGMLAFRDGHFFFVPLFNFILIFFYLTKSIYFLYSILLCVSFRCTA